MGRWSLVSNFSLFSEKNHFLEVAENYGVPTSGCLGGGPHKAKNRVKMKKNPYFSGYFAFKA